MGPLHLALNLFLFLYAAVALGQQGPRVVPGEYLIKFKASAGGVVNAHRKLQGKAALKGNYPGLGVMHVAMKLDASQKANYDELKNDPDVEYIEPNFIVDKSEVAANEPVQRLSTQQVISFLGVNTNPASYSQSADVAGVAASWPLLVPLSPTEEKVVVAIVDTGIDSQHDVFKPFNSDGTGGTGALWDNRAEIGGIPGVDDDQNGFIDDYHGWNFINNSNVLDDDDSHGTHLAGIIVGTGQNIFARPLQESKIAVMPLKFLGANGEGTTSNAVRAIYYAVNNGARVINNSWGGSGYSRALLDALVYAYDHQVLIVCAAGNYSSNNDNTPIYPANFDIPSNISVASVGSHDSLSVFSNYGVAKVHVGSPGEYIESTVPNNMIMPMSGTSMATPFVAGIAALAYREAPLLSGFQMKQLILDTAEPINSLSRYVSSGGRIDAYSLIQMAKANIAASALQPNYTPQVDRTPSSSSDGGAGCGLIKAVTMKGPGQNSSGNDGFGGTAAMVVVFLLAPLALLLAMRKSEVQADDKNKRRYERFKMNSEVRVLVGDRELIGSVQTISQGGLSFNADAALEKGGTVTMKIQSPDGNETIEVQGHVVWMESSQSYGVQFANAKRGTLEMIRDWTANLMKI